MHQAGFLLTRDEARRIEPTSPSCQSCSASEIEDDHAKRGKTPIA
jgi:hypothetical protein